MKKYILLTLFLGSLVSLPAFSANITFSSPKVIPGGVSNLNHTFYIGVDIYHDCKNSNKNSCVFTTTEVKVQGGGSNVLNPSSYGNDAKFIFINSIIVDEQPSPYAWNQTPTCKENLNIYSNQQSTTFKVGLVHVGSATMVECNQE